MSEKSIFISRRLDPDSVFLQRLRAAGHSVSGLSLVQITALPYAAVPDCDWIFFSSRNGVQCFFQPAPGSRGRPPEPASKVQYAALGPGTAAALRPFVSEIQFIGTGEAETTARQFRSRAAGQRILFPCAKNSRRSVQKALQDAATLIDFCVYDNRAVPDPPFREENILVFTSPLNVRAYCSRHRIRPDQRVVAIGSPTGDALQEFGVTEVVIAPEATEAALAETVCAMSD